jgi:hypothetical protein
MNLAYIVYRLNTDTLITVRSAKWAYNATVRYANMFSYVKRILTRPVLPSLGWQNGHTKAIVRYANLYSYVKRILTRPVLPSLGWQNGRDRALPRYVLLRVAYSVPCMHPYRAPTAGDQCSNRILHISSIDLSELAGIPRGCPCLLHESLTHGHCARSPHATAPQPSQNLM